MQEKYIVHVSGPDDILGPYTEIDALKLANEINKAWVEEAKKHGFNNIALNVATVKRG